MKKQSIVALAVFVVVAGVAIAAIWTKIIPQYQAKGQVRVCPIVPRLVLETEDNGMIPLYDSFVNTQVAIMRSPAVLQRVLDHEEVRDTQWYKKPAEGLRGSTVTPMERLRDNLSVQPRTGTEMVEVSFTADSAKEAELIVDTVLDEYLKHVRKTPDKTESLLYRELVDQYKSLENEIRGREKVSAELRRSLGAGTPQEVISSKRIRLDETKARLSELNQSIAVLERAMKQATTDDSNDVPVAAAGWTQKQPKYHEDAEWRSLNVDVRTIRHNIATSQLEPSNPDIVRMKNDLKLAEELLRLREAQLDEQWRDRLRNQLAQAKHKEQLLLAELKKQQADFDRLFESTQLLEKESNVLLHKRKLSDAVRQRLDQKDVERNVPVGSIEVAMRALAPSQPYNDRRIVFTAVALVLSLGLGGGAAFLSKRLNSSSKQA